MRPESFIAYRLFYARTNQKRATRPAVRVALLGIIIGVVVMVLTLCIVVGFKGTVYDKIAGFGSHIQITDFEENNTYELSPITVSDSLLHEYEALPHIVSAHSFSTKPGVVKTSDAFRGIVVKGTDYWDYFASQLVRGQIPSAPNQILMSEHLADLLQLDVDSTFYCYFIGEQMRVRKWKIAGLYETGFQEYDDLFLLSDERTVRQLNLWADSLSSGIELFIDDLDNLEQAYEDVYFYSVNRLQDNGELLYAQTIEQLNPQIFSWLDLLDMNVIVIIVLMLCVSGFSIISGLIILILDSIQLIGVLKALGATNRFVRRIFITQAAMLIVRGMVWGNAIGLGLACLQYATHVIPLDPASYYVNFVPIAFPWIKLIMLNIGTLVVSVLILLAPSAIVTRISPARVMHFD